MTHNRTHHMLSKKKWRGLSADGLACSPALCFPAIFSNLSYYKTDREAHICPRGTWASAQGVKWSTLKHPRHPFLKKTGTAECGLFDRRKNWRKQTVSIRFWWLTPCTLQTHLLLAQRARTHIICFPNTPTHTFAHRAARHWVFLNTVLLGSLLYNECLRDIQRLSHLFNVTVGNICPKPRHDSLLSFHREKTRMWREHFTIFTLYTADQLFPSLLD